MVKRPPEALPEPLAGLGHDPPNGRHVAVLRPPTTAAPWARPSRRRSRGRSKPPSGPPSAGRARGGAAGCRRASRGARTNQLQCTHDSAQVVRPHLARGARARAGGGPWARAARRSRGRRGSGSPPAGAAAAPPGRRRACRSGRSRPTSGARRSPASRSAMRGSRDRERHGRLPGERGHHGRPQAQAMPEQAASRRPRPRRPRQASEGRASHARRRSINAMQGGGIAATWANARKWKSTVAAPRRHRRGRWRSRSPSRPWRRPAATRPTSASTARRPRRRGDSGGTAHAPAAGRAALGRRRRPGRRHRRSRGAGSRRAARRRSSSRPRPRPRRPQTTPTETAPRSRAPEQNAEQAPGEGPARPRPGAAAVARLPSTGLEVGGLRRPRLGLAAGGLGASALADAGTRALRQSRRLRLDSARASGPPPPIGPGHQLLGRRDLDPEHLHAPLERAVGVAVDLASSGSRSS